MPLLIALIGIYGSLFLAAQWGVAGLAIGAAVTFFAARFWLHREREKAKETKRKLDEAYALKRADDVKQFFSAGRTFVGDRNIVYEFEHLYDLAAEVAIKWPDLDSICIHILDWQQGKIAVVDPRGWPSEAPRRELTQLFQYLTLHAEPGSRHETLFIPTSERAKQIDAEKRDCLRRSVEERIAERSTSLGDRTAADLGEDAIAVYIISSSKQRSSKVGISNDPQRRLKGLQTGNALTLSVSSVYWMRSRDDALLLESETHRELLRRGYKRKGEWFPVETEGAADAIAKAYDRLLEHGVVDQIPIAVSESATDAELANSLAKSLPWRISKRSNLTTMLGGRRITVFKKRNGWSWVVEGQFSKDSFGGPEEAQLDCVRRFVPDRETTLALITGQKTPNR